MTHINFVFLNKRLNTLITLVVYKKHKKFLIDCIYLFYFYFLVLGLSKKYLFLEKFHIWFKQDKHKNDAVFNFFEITTKINTPHGIIFYYLIFFAFFFQMICDLCKQSIQIEWHRKTIIDDFWLLNFRKICYTTKFNHFVVFLFKFWEFIGIMRLKLMT